jgi:translation initiation factor IF-2
MRNYSFIYLHFVQLELLEILKKWKRKIMSKGYVIEYKDEYGSGTFIVVIAYAYIVRSKFFVVIQKDFIEIH